MNNQLREPSSESFQSLSADALNNLSSSLTDFSSAISEMQLSNSFLVSESFSKQLKSIQESYIRNLDLTPKYSELVESFSSSLSATVRESFQQLNVSAFTNFSSAFSSLKSIQESYVHILDLTPALAELAKSLSSISSTIANNFYVPQFRTDYIETLNKLSETLRSIDNLPVLSLQSEMEENEEMEIPDEFYDAVSEAYKFANATDVICDIPDIVEPALENRPKAISKRDYKKLFDFITLILAVITVVFGGIQIIQNIESGIADEARHADYMAVEAQKVNALERIADAEERQADSAEKSIALQQQTLDALENLNDSTDDFDVSCTNVNESIDQSGDISQPMVNHNNGNTVYDDTNQTEDLPSSQP